MKIDSEKQEEMVPSPPPVDVPRDIVVGQKRPTWTLSDSAGGRKTCSSLWYLPREKETSKILCYAAAMSHIIDSEPSCYEEASSMERCHDGGVLVHHEE
jgi:hypothetical protein